MTAADISTKELLAEIESLRLRLEEAEDTLRAIGGGEVDAFVVSGPQGERIFTLEGAEQPYRLLVESMNEGAATLADDGTIFYCNSRLAAMLRAPLESVFGTEFSSYMAPSDREVFAAMLMKCPEMECRGEFALITGEGAPLPVQLSCNALEVAGTRGASVIVTDLTEQKEQKRNLAEQFRELEETHRELEISRDRYSDLFDFAPLGYVCLDKRGVIRDINLTGAKQLGSARDDLTGTSLLARLRGNDKRILQKHLRSCGQTKGMVESELTISVAEGAEIYARLFSIPSSGPTGDTLYRTAIIDISERKRMEELQQYRAVVDDLTEIICRVKPDGTITFVNDVYCRIFGKTRDEVLGSTWQPDVFPGDLPVVEEHLHRLSPADPVIVVENRVYTGSGELRWLQFVNRGFFDSEGRLTQIQAVARDITERKEAETALRLTEERLSLALAAAKMGVWDWNVQTNALSWSPETIEILGVENFTGTFECFSNILHPDDVDRVFATARQALAEKSTFSLEYRIIRADGQVRWLSDLARPIYDDEGNPLRMVGTVHDITERKLAEEKLRASESQLADAQKIAHLGSWQWDPESCKISGSDEFHVIFGRFFFTYDEFIEMVHPDDRTMVDKAARDTLDRQSSFDLNHRIVRPDGTIRIIHCRGEARVADDGQPARIVGTVQDITERRQMEEQIVIMHNRLVARAAELEAANVELEAFNHSVSHDLRRPLTVINSYCQVVEELCGDKLDEECRSGLREIYASTLQMSRLIETLLIFSRVTRGEMRLEKVNLSRIAEEISLGLKMTELKRRVTFRIADGITADADAGLLRVVLDNLLGNAWKFTGGREEAVIEFGVTEIDGKQACYVRDNGAGFDMAYAEKLFLPFQRLPGTKTDGHGIGLATADRIVRRHGGRVWAESRPGNGATFFFTLPGGLDAAGRRP